MADNEEKVFEHFLKLSPNLRTAIIDEMAPDDRCRFTRCSKVCNQEAKASKNYIFGMCIVDVKYGVSVTIKFDKDDMFGFSHFYLQLITRKVEYCTTYDDQTLWEEKMDESIDLDQYANEEIGRLFQSYGNSIKILGLIDVSRRNLDLDIEKLKNLEFLQVSGDTDVLDVLSKLQKPLKKLSIKEVEDNELYTNCEQIYQVEDILIWRYAPLYNQEFLQISASYIKIHIGHLTERDIFNFIRSWQNGTIGKNFQWCQWNWEESDFDQEKLARLLRFSEFQLNPEDDEYEFELEIQHFNEPGKSALLLFTEEYLMFDTTRTGVQDDDIV